MVSNSSADRYTVIPVSGKLMGGPETDRFSEKIAEHRDDGILNLILDLSGVRWINSAGVGALVAHFVSFRNRKGTIRFANLSPKVQEIFEITKLDSVMEVYDTVEQAGK